MSKIIPIKNDVYIEILKGIIDRLSSIPNELDEYAVNLAVTGVWKEWNKKMENGTEFDFGESIYETGDKNIDELLNLREILLETIKKLKTNNKLKM